MQFMREHTYFLLRRTVESQAPKPKAKRNPGTPKPSSHSLNHDQFTLAGHHHKDAHFFGSFVICLVAVPRRCLELFRSLATTRWEHLWLL